MSRKNNSKLDCLEVEIPILTFNIWKGEVKVGL
jgi:hypothetical protein